MTEGHLEGTNFKFNGGFKIMVSAIITVMWSLLLIFGQGFANNITKRVENNSSDVVDLKVAAAHIDEKLDYIIERVDRISP